jgi:hypothetical protein
MPIMRMIQEKEVVAPAAAKLVTGKRKTRRRRMTASYLQCRKTERNTEESLHANKPIPHSVIALLPGSFS